jgi:hypothetical protein
MRRGCRLATVRRPSCGFLDPSHDQPRKTAEGKLKGGEVAAAEEPWPWVLLVETGGIGFAQALADRYFKPADLVGHGLGADAVLARHRLQLSMDQA